MSWSDWQFLCLNLTLRPCMPCCTLMCRCRCRFPLTIPKIGSSSIPNRNVPISTQFSAYKVPVSTIPVPRISQTTTGMSSLSGWLGAGFLSCPTFCLPAAWPGLWSVGMFRSIHPRVKNRLSCKAQATFSWPVVYLGLLQESRTGQCGEKVSQRTVWVAQKICLCQIRIQHNNYYSDKWKNKQTTVY